MVMDNQIWDRNSSRPGVISRCGGDKKLMTTQNRQNMTNELPPHSDSMICLNLHEQTHPSFVENKKYIQC